MLFFHIGMTQVVEILGRVRPRTHLFYIVNIMGADVLATQGARASAAMIFTKMNRIHSVPARLGLTEIQPLCGLGYGLYWARAA